jgi:hypothetical protein
MHANCDFGPNHPQQSKARRYASFQQIAAQLNPLSPAALRSNRGGNRIDTDLNHNSFAHDLVTIFSVHGRTREG